ncbi:MAG: cytochrome c oxidase subunit II [Methylococcaceae bacterium TMED69]|nr:cytochrome c oxidase subunit II [Pseudomonadota bacterium]OUU75328.1 MAG: cytochrome c oxidase subunit II [Methylococcaceae bacterium TMED69]
MTLIKKLITTYIITAPLLALASEVENVNDNKWGLNLSKGVTPFSQDIYDLHMIVLFIVTIIGVGVFGAMFYAMYAFRKSKGAQAEAWHENHVVEAIWTVIPLFILVGIAVPATEALIKMEDVSGSEMTVKVTGYQWMWQYDYVDSGVSMYSKIAESSNFARQRGSGVDPSSVENYLLDVDQMVVLPVDTKIRFLTTAADVIHAWWVPALGWKRDAIPGFINESWAKIEKTGIYRGQCAELCGKDHGFMPIVIKVVEKNEFNRWVALQLENTDTREFAKN